MLIFEPNLVLIDIEFYAKVVIVLCSRCYGPYSAIALLCSKVL